MPVIRMDDVSFRYPGTSSDNSSVQLTRHFSMHVHKLSVERGERIALVGPSGSGKTTLLSLLAGILRPERGTIQVNDRDICRLGDAAVRQFRITTVGQVFQSFELLEYLSVLENVMLPWFISRDPAKPGSAKAEYRRRAFTLLQEVGLENRLNNRPGQLSQGEQQRVAVCRAMLNQPSLILADEPTGNLDQANKQKVVDLLLQKARQNDSTLLMVTHDLSLLDRFDTVMDISTVLGEGKES